LETKMNEASDRTGTSGPRVDGEVLGAEAESGVPWALLLLYLSFLVLFSWYALGARADGLHGDAAHVEAPATAP